VKAGNGWSPPGLANYIGRTHPHLPLPEPSPHREWITPSVSPGKLTSERRGRPYQDVSSAPTHIHPVTNARLHQQAIFGRISNSRRAPFRQFVSLWRDVSLPNRSVAPFPDKKRPQFSTSQESFGKSPNIHIYNAKLAKCPLDVASMSVKLRFVTGESESSLPKSPIDPSCHRPRFNSLRPAWENLVSLCRSGPPSALVRRCSGAWLWVSERSCSLFAAIIANCIGRGRVGLSASAIVSRQGFLPDPPPILSSISTRGCRPNIG
jgi:hypothetical protein